MSISVMWQPVRKKSICHGCGRVAEALVRAYGHAAGHGRRL